LIQVAAGGQDDLVAGRFAQQLVEGCVFGVRLDNRPPRLPVVDTVLADERGGLG
jgi:hypothetical protein